MGCNTIGTWAGGIANHGTNSMEVGSCGISDNLLQGILVESRGYIQVQSNFGDNNGNWGTYARLSGQATCTGVECSGALGNHSNGVGDGSLAY